MRGRYVQELLQLPTQPAVAARVLELACAAGGADEGPFDELTQVVATDPVLAARLLRLANSVQYGAPRLVSSVRHAVVLLGSTAVAGLAVSSACQALGPQPTVGTDEPGTPEGFWEHALATAAAASAVAGRLGHSPGDAFAVGLLHDLGSLLFHRRDPARARAARLTPGGTARRLAAELRAFGCTHAQAGAAALEAWSFPRPFVEAVLEHHGASEPGHALGRLVRVGEALALVLQPAADHGDGADLERLLPAIGLRLSAAPGLLDEIAGRLDDATAVLGGGR